METYIVVDSETRKVYEVKATDGWHAINIIAKRIGHKNGLSSNKPVKGVKYE